MGIFDTYNKFTLTFLAVFIFSGFYEYFFRVYGVSSFIFLAFGGALSAFYIFFRFPLFLKNTPFGFVGLIFIFFAFAPLSLLSADYYLEFSYFFNTLQYLLLGSSIGVYLSLNKKRDIKFFLFLCLLANSSGVIFSLLGFIELSYLRVTGFFNNANFMAIHLGLFGLLALVSFNNMYAKWLIIFFTTLLLFFTFSRAGMICWILSLAVYLINYISFNSTYPDVSELNFEC